MTTRGGVSIGMEGHLTLGAGRDTGALDGCIYLAEVLGSARVFTGLRTASSDGGAELLTLLFTKRRGIRRVYGGRRLNRGGLSRAAQDPEDAESSVWDYGLDLLVLARLDSASDQWGPSDQWGRVML